MDTLNNLLKWLDNIQGISAVGLVFLSCVVVGYILRFIQKFPNDGIPVVVVLWGAIAMLVIADPRANSMPARVWTMRNVLTGLVIGMVAWITHKLIISRIEEFISTKFNLGNTQFFNKPESTPPSTETPTPNPKTP